VSGRKCDVAFHRLLCEEYMNLMERYAAYLTDFALSIDGNEVKLLDGMSLYLHASIEYKLGVFRKKFFL